MKRLITILLKKLSHLNGPWLGVLGLLAILLFIEILHVRYHEQGKAWLEAPECFDQRD